MSKVPLYNNIEELWGMSQWDFNEWRVKNDLPILFEFFHERLPGFKDWLQEFSIAVNDAIKTIPTSDLFKGITPRYLVEYELTPDNLWEGNRERRLCGLQKAGELERYIVVRDGPEERIKEAFIPNLYTIIRIIKFMPYLHWAKIKFGPRNFIKVSEVNKEFASTFCFGQWEGIGGSKSSRAFLLKGFPVLKLGGIAPRNCVMDGKNLDFTDLDGLVIKGNYHGTHATSISFSSCRVLRLVDCQVNHVTFYKCEMEQVVSQRAILQSLFFEECRLGIDFIDTKLYECGFIRCALGIEFRNCDIHELKYIPSPVSKPEQVFLNCRRIRMAYQSIGQTDEASHYYYLERYYEGILFKNPHSYYWKEFPLRRGYNGTLKDIYTQWKNQQFDNQATLKHLFWIASFHIRCLIVPKYLLKTIKFKLRYGMSLFEWLIWGFGEKPSRILLTILIIVSTYSGIYYCSGQQPISDSLLNSVYFSVVTLTTLGYGDIRPENPYLKLICCSEALVGALLLGLLVAGYSQKSRR